MNSLLIDSIFRNHTTSKNGNKGASNAASRIAGKRAKSASKGGMMTKRTPVHVWHLEMTARPDKTTKARNYTLQKTARPMPELNRFLYTAVGGPWLWYQRLGWQWHDWNAWLSRPSVETWVAYQDATPIGYFELERQTDASAEIAYFGLVPEFIGKGFGRQLLEDAIEKAWNLADKRIWLHTCSFDHPGALPNYLARGFSLFKEEDFQVDAPAERLQPWPNAAKP
ncbi:MAG: GNAT family N-acetyltransferase [Pseudomonadales bacterium]